MNFQRSLGAFGEDSDSDDGRTKSHYLVINFSPHLDDELPGIFDRVLCPSMKKIPGRGRGGRGRVGRPRGSGHKTDIGRGRGPGRGRRRGPGRPPLCGKTVRERGRQNKGKLPRGAYPCHICQLPI